MAKAASPIRIQQDLMQTATIEGVKHNRSASEQIEYWASLGRGIARVIDPDVLLSLRAGLSKLEVVPVVSQPIDPDDVFSALEQDRNSGKLSQNCTTTGFRYQSSNQFPGYLERINEDGTISVGQFTNGEFVPRN